MTRFTGPEPAESPAVQNPASTGNLPPAAPPGRAPASSISKPPPAPVSAPIQGKKARQIVVESDDYQITLSTQGAVVKSWVLKKYRDADDKPLDLVNQEACQQLGLPLTLSLADA